MEDRDPVPITSPPANGQLVSHENKIFTTVKEGGAHILVPPNARTSVNPNAKAKADEEQKVFYNPIQQFNRDLSVLAIKAYGEDLCKRKTAAREVKRKKEEGKRERRRQKKAEGDAEAVVAEGGRHATDAGEEIRGHASTLLANTSSKRKRDEEDEGENEGQARKAQKGGDLNKSHAEDVETIPIDGLNGNKGPNQENTANGTARPSDTTPKSWQPSFRILDALSATGLRALRYATEIPTATAILANDRDKGATSAIALNVQHNDLATKVSTSTGDAIGHMYAAAFPPTHSHGQHHISGKYDVIDLDPYGTAAPFIDAALQALNDEGMLCVTCTDSGVFASCGYSEKTFSLYGGMPIKGTHAHEGGLRLILHSIAASAAKYSIAIEPLLSLSIDFYARLFIRARKSPADVKFLAGKTMLVYECDVGCGAWSTQFLGRHQRHGKDESSWKYHIAMAPASDRLCEHCGSKMHIAGPMWGGPLHNAAFVEKVLDDAREADKDVYQTLPRIEGMLDTALNELLVNPETLGLHNIEQKKGTESSLIPATPPHLSDHHPFYFLPSALCKVIKSQAPPEAAIKGALRRLGYVVTRSHAKAGSLKTDAPWSVLWEVMREWVRQRSPVKIENLREGGPGHRILGMTRKVLPAFEGQEGKDAGAGASSDGTGNAATEANDDSAMPDAAAAANASGETPEITTDTAQQSGTSAPASKPDPVAEKDVSKLEIVFDEKLGQDEDDRAGKGGGKSKKRLVRYQQNPRENWGPMARAKGHA